MALQLSDPPRSRVCRRAYPGTHVATIAQGAWQEHHLTLSALPGEMPGDLLDRMARFLDDDGAAVLKQTVFGGAAGYPAAMAAVEEALGEVAWPVTWVDGAGCRGQAIAGMQVHAVTGRLVETLWCDGRPVGRTFADGDTSYAILGDVRPLASGAPRTEQAYSAFCALDAVLRSAGMSFADVARTWLFIDNILDWYPAFNGARDTFFTERGVFDGLVPASTGIGCANPHGAALVAEAYAVRDRSGQPASTPVASPLQCPAPRYGSAFSRAVEVCAGGSRRVLVSGTASIAPDGQSAHCGDTAAQVRLTLEVVEAILAERAMGFEDVTRAIAYFRDPADAPLLGSCPAGRALQPLATVVRADVCRDELLFEIELDAVAG